MDYARYRGMEVRRWTPPAAGWLSADEVEAVLKELVARYDEAKEAQ